MSESGQFRYPECSKGEHHVGQVLNLVCLQPKCIQKSIICGICYDEAHRNHKIKPLKLIINNSKKYLEGLTPLALDVQKVKTSITATRDTLLASFSQFEKYVNESLTAIRTNINAIFIKVLDQIELKAGKNDQLLSALEEIRDREIQYNRFVTLMQKLLAGVPIESQEEESEMSGSEIEKAVEAIQKKAEKDLKEREGKIRQELTKLLEGLQKTADNPSIFDSKIEFKFSPELKHAGISVVSDTVIKSVEAYNYHFCLMEPSIQEKGNRAFKVAFKVVENSSNWLGMGVCYKNTIVENNFNFNYSTLGHGGYLISSNGGSWSSIDAGKNNTVTSFNFQKGDIITVEYQPGQTKVTFRKKGTQDIHHVEYQPRDDDELYLCGLFYYNNDEIEYLGYDQE